MRHKKQKVTVGLDIGSRVIKAVVLSNNGSKNHLPKLLNYAIDTLSTNGDALSDADISEFIKKVFSDSHIAEKEINAAVSGNSAVVRYINFRKMPVENMRDAIKFEASQHIPFDIKDVELDFSVLDDKIPSEPNMMRVLLVAAKKDECRRLVKILQAAGLTPMAIDVDSIALVNSYVFCKEEAANEKPIALVNIGAKKTSLAIIQDGKPVFTRNVEIGGDGMTLAIARGMSIEVHEAEQLKIAGEQIAHEHIKIVLDSIVRQLRTSFDYFEGISGGEVSHVYLSGGAAMLKGLADHLTANLNIPVSIWDPLSHIDKNAFESDAKLKAIYSSLDVAIGLALRGVSNVC
jgi:type IV pilus assembly protein PilM